MFVQQIAGIVTLSAPIVMLYQIYPPILRSYWGIFLCALMVSGLTYYFNRRAVFSLVNSLVYTPSGEHKENFDALIKSCQVDPTTIRLNYAYTNESVAMAALNTVIIDPVSMDIAEADPQAQRVKEIFKHSFKLTLTEMAQKRLSLIAEVLTPAAQRFIFRHEVGHVVHNYSHKKLYVIGIIGFLAAYIGMVTAMAVMPVVGGLIALCMGMTVGGFTDLFLSYASNISFKAYEEKKADLFAGKHSSPEEIEAAALFFENHAAILSSCTEYSGVLPALPSILATGHLDGVSRGRYLRTLVEQKNTNVTK